MYQQRCGGASRRMAGAMPTSQVGLPASSLRGQPAFTAELRCVGSSMKPGGSLRCCLTCSINLCCLGQPQHHYAGIAFFRWKQCRALLPRGLQ